MLGKSYITAIRWDPHIVQITINDVFILKGRWCCYYSAPLNETPKGRLAFVIEIGMGRVGRTIVVISIINHEDNDDAKGSRFDARGSEE